MIKALIRRLFEPNKEGLYTPHWITIKGCCQTIAYNYWSGYSTKKWNDEFEQTLGRSMLKYANYRMFLACRLWAYVNKPSKKRTTKL